MAIAPCPCALLCCAVIRRNGRLLEFRLGCVFTGMRVGAPKKIWGSIEFQNPGEYVGGVGNASGGAVIRSR